jgi:hypothetical protein
MSTNSQLPQDQRTFNERIISLFEKLGIPYGICGSVASMSYAKTSRFTNDFDLMLDIDSTKLELLVSEVEQWQVYIDPLETIFEFNLPGQLPINILDATSGTKADLFVVQHEGLDVAIMSRLQRRKLYVKPDFFAWFLSPEDVILYKLIYFKKSEGTSQKHPMDIHAMLRGVEAELDLAYLEKWAHVTDVFSLWQTVKDEFHLN